MGKVQLTRFRLLLPAALAGAALAAPAAAEAAAAVPERTEGVTVKRYLMGRLGPSTQARGAAHLWTNTGFSNRRAVYPVLQRRVMGNGSEWVQVRALRKRTQVNVWIPAWATRKVEINYRVRIDISSRRTTVFRDGKVLRRFRVVVGKRSTPTPTGRFYTVDRVRLQSSWAQRRMAIAVSAFSRVLKTFDGGIGQIAMHPRALLRDPVGTAASNGCIRFNNRDMAWLVKRIPNGTPVEIQR